jgi:hypothetical protein
MRRAISAFFARHQNWNRENHPARGRGVQPDVREEGSFSRVTKITESSLRSRRRELWLQVKRSGSGSRDASPGVEHVEHAKSAHDW